MDHLLARGPSQEYWFEEGVFITELLNHPAVADASVARARLPAGRRTRWHALDGTSEHYIIESGTGVAEVGPQSIRVGPGDQVIIPAGERQRIAADPGAELVFLCVCTPRFEPQNYRDLEALHG